VNDDERSARLREGLIYGLVAYVLWGAMPLYFTPIAAAIDPFEILCHRIVWSLLFVLLLIAVMRRWQALKAALTQPKVFGLLIVSALLVCCNWFVYIYGVASKQVVQTSLGYFTNPLVSVVLGMVFFRERLRPLQWVALGLAAVGVVSQLILGGYFPWISLSIAISFGFYGLVRKHVPVDGLTGLTVESMVLTPIALGFLLFWHFQGTLGFGGPDATVNILVMLGGVVTALPLLFFGQAARRLPLTLLGIMQYLSPSLQLLVAIFLLNQTPPQEALVALGWTWAGLVVFTLDSLWLGRKKPVVATATTTSGPEEEGPSSLQPLPAGRIDV